MSTTRKVHYHVKVTNMHQEIMNDFVRPYSRPAQRLAKSICNTLVVNQGPNKPHDEFRFRITSVTFRHVWRVGNKYWNVVISVEPCIEQVCQPSEDEYRFWKGAK
jgi:hypothetical protein